MLLDWTSNQICELPWQRTGCERFCFDYGEVNGPLGTLGCICKSWLACFDLLKLSSH